MNSVLLILVTILVFGVIIIIHELGHFVAARLSKVKINEFSIGMGPAIWTSKKEKEREEEDAADPENPEDNKTKYSLRALPIGGYVAMEGEDQSSGDKNAFCNKPIWKRIIIVVAGATMNLLLGFIILVCVYATVERIPTREIAVFDDDATSSAYGLQVGDEIRKVNGRAVYTYSDIVTEVLGDDDGVMDFVVMRDGEKITLEGVTFETVITDEERSLNFDFKLNSVDRSFGSVISYSFNSAVSLGRSIWLSLGDLVTGKVSFTQLSGPIGVGVALGEAAAVNIQSMFILIAFLSINVGIFNLLPIPALDGGRLIFLLIELVCRKPVPAKYEGAINAVGMLLLFGLMIVIAFKDVFSLIF